MSKTYDFDQVLERRDTNSVKWNKYHGRDILPMWVADSDFAVEPMIQQAMHDRADHPSFGYSEPPARLIELLVERMAERYGWQIEPSWLVFLPGVVGALFLACRAVGKVGDSVLMPSVVYPPFNRSAELNQREQQLIPMCWRDGRQVIDIDWLAKQSIPAGQLLLLCNPQNPGGGVYRQSELAQLAEIAEQKDLVICSDEIHCDLILDAQTQHLPIASLNSQIANRSITLMAPSKTFNLAGLGCSFAIVPDRALRRKIKVNPYIVPHVNIMGYAAAEAAYEHGEDWNRQQCEYLAGNRDYLIEQINSIAGLSLEPVEASYLAWIDVSGLKLEDPMSFFEMAGVGLSAGSDFGDSNYMRLNFACPRGRIEEAIRRIKVAVADLSSSS